MGPLGTIIAQFLMGWLQQKCGGTDPKPAVSENYDADTDTFDPDFMAAGIKRAKKADRRLRRQDKSQPKASYAELQRQVESHYRTALNTPDTELAVMCAAIQPITDED